MFSFKWLLIAVIVVLGVSYVQAATASHDVATKDFSFSELEAEVNAGLGNEADADADADNEAEHEHEEAEQLEATAEADMADSLEKAHEAINEDVNLAEVNAESNNENEAEAENEQEAEAENEHEAEHENEHEVDAEHEDLDLSARDPAIEEALQKVAEADEIASFAEVQSTTAVKDLQRMAHLARVARIQEHQQKQTAAHSALLEAHSKLLAQREKAHSDILAQEELSLVQQAEQLHLNSPDILLDPLLKVKSMDEKIETQSALSAVGLDDKTQAEKEMNDALSLLETHARKIAVAASKPSAEQRAAVAAARQQAMAQKQQKFSEREYGITPEQRGEHDAALAEQDEQDYLASRIHH